MRMFGALGMVVFVVGLVAWLVVSYRHDAGPRQKRLHLYCTGAIVGGFFAAIVGSFS